MNEMIAYFQHLNYWDWFGFALLLLVLEIFVSGTFFMWMGGAAATVGLCLIVVSSLEWKLQLVLFTVLSVTSIVLWKKYSKDSPQSQSLGLNKRGNGYIGKRFTLTSPIVSGVGKLIIDDTTWRIEGDDAQAGESVEVVGLNGMALQVKKVG